MIKKEGKMYNKYTFGTAEGNVFYKNEARGCTAFGNTRRGRERKSAVVDRALLSHLVTY